MRRVGAAVAAALVFDRVNADEVSAMVVRDARVSRILDSIALVEDAEFSRRFPAERWARVSIALTDGRTLTSEPARARGNPENPLSDAELDDKYAALAEPALGVERATRIADAVASLARGGALAPLLSELLAPLDPNQTR